MRNPLVRSKRTKRTQPLSQVRGLDVDGRARWQVVYNELHTLIEEGKYAPGEQLPPERELVERFGFSRATIRTALTRLEQAGLVYAGAGSVGRTVRRPLEIHFDASKFEVGAYKDDEVRGVDQWLSNVEEQGWEGRQVVTVTTRSAPQQVARWLAVEPGTRLVRRRRVRMVRKPPGVEWIPVMLADSWFPEDVAHRKVDGIAPLLEERDITMPGGIIRSIGIRQVKFVDEIRSRMPADDERSLLALPTGTPVGEHARIGIDEHGRRIRVLASVFAGDKQYVRYELPVAQPEAEVKSA
ncbi:GntR family transcriptional regulator [Actinosynnema sp. ALI-1.44]|uniref:GntR family transcriptional regulator n=1 Tax=Actinosynnema sp. ALI-1.44 TaxID=1933779 RepID=UPI0009FF4840|nr:GntR family transcriptional regulator [Actinosynnema sp. ALI-1.44]